MLDMGIYLGNVYNSTLWCDDLGPFFEQPCTSENARKDSPGYKKNKHLSKQAVVTQYIYYHPKYW